MSGPELLTDEDIHALGQLNTHGERVAFLRERGLIAPEPVDELKLIASEVAMGFGYDPSDLAADLALAALKRGMELAPAASPLTRERLADAIVKVFGEGERGFGNVTPNNITALHTALTERPA